MSPERTDTATPGIAVALDAERKTLTPDSIAPGSCARLPGGALVAVAGVGPERARAAADRLLSAGATALVSWGVAAGLDPALAAGSLVLPRTIVEADGRVHRVAVAWHAELWASLARTTVVYVGPLAEATGLLEHPRQKQALLERHGAIAADLESAALARAAAQGGVPFLAVRAVADRASGRVPRWVAGVVDTAGGAGFVRALIAACAHPRDWPALATLALQFRAAERTLRRVGPVFLSLGPRPSGAERGR